MQRLIRFYNEKGFADIKINYDVEYFDNNSVIIYFNISEGIVYELSEVSFKNKSNNDSIDKLLSDYFNNNEYVDKIYNSQTVDQIEKKISGLVKSAGIQFFEINKLVNLNNGKADLLFEIQESIPTHEGFFAGSLKLGLTFDRPFGA